MGSSSSRERRLWLLTAAVIAAIYASLGVVRDLAGILREQGLIGSLFWLGLILVGAAVVMQGLKRRPGRLEIGIALGIAGAYLLTFLRMTIPEERSHMIEYSVVALLTYEALKERVSQGRRVPIPALLAVLGTSLIGAVDEGIQLFLPNRVFDPLDILFNFLAALMAVTGSAALAWARRRRKGRAA